MAAYKFKLFVGVMFVLLVFFQYRLWVGPGGIREMTSLKKQLAVQTENNDKLKKRNQILLSEIENLHHDDAVESRARDELGMIKKGETFYQIVK